MNKNSIGLIIAGALIILVGIVIGASSKGGSIGGSTSDDWNVGGALNVTGATNLAGAVSATSNLNVDAANATTTIAVGNTGVGKLCLWNGTQYSVLSFAAGATSTTIATSTTCQ